MIPPPRLEYAPFSPNQILRMKIWQGSGFSHPLTCTCPAKFMLVATKDGLICLDPECNRKQTWAPFCVAGPREDENIMRIEKEFPVPDETQQTVSAVSQSNQAPKTQTIEDIFQPADREHIVAIGTSVGNSMAFIHDPVGNSMFVTVYLQMPKLSRRIANSFGYITGWFYPRSGHYDNFVIENCDIPALRAFLKKIEED